MIVGVRRVAGSAAGGQAWREARTVPGAVR